MLILCRVALGKEKVLYAAEGDLPGNLGKTLIFFPGIKLCSGNHDSIKAIGQNVPSKEDEFASSIVPSGKLVKYEKVCEFRSTRLLIYCLAGSLLAFVQRIRRLRYEADRNTLRR